MLTYYPTDSLLHRTNPTIKLLAVVVLVVLVTFAYDVATPLIYLLLTIMALRFGGQLPLRWVAGSLAPFVVVALGFLLTNLLFARPVLHPTSLFSLGPLTVTAQAVGLGLAVGLRVLFIGASSLLLIGTTEPTRLVVSLILQAKLNYRIAYATLVAYRFVPLLAAEYRTIRAASRIRGRKGGLRGLLRDTIPLLAGAIRRAERIALAMDSRAFAAYPTRTYRQPTSIERADWLFLLISVGGGSLLFAVLVASGITRGLGAQFAG